jgi:hypothetical protein
MQILQLQINQGYNLQDIKFRLRYFLGENLVNGLNLRQAENVCLLQLDNENKDNILGVIHHLPCTQINTNN